MNCVNLLSAWNHLKVNIYCLLNEDRREEAQLLFDLTKERGLKDSFFENKINFLLGYNVEQIQKIRDDNLLNFYLSQITIKDFDYKPNAKTNKYIWKFYVLEFFRPCWPSTCANEMSGSSRSVCYQSFSSIRRLAAARMPQNHNHEYLQKSEEHHQNVNW